MKKCEICAENQAKYKCPGCLVQTCSLPCVKHHKTVNGCTGQRNKTAFVKVKEFTDRHLLNDYRFLEETNRRIDSTHRDQLKKRSNRPNFLNTLVKEARKRGINLKIMPYPMARRKNNFTTYQYKSRTIFWYVQWVFPQADTKFTAKRLSEHTTLAELLKEYIHPTESDPVKRHALKSYCKAGIHRCRLFMKVEERHANDVRYHELSMTKSLQQNLVGKCVVEYPIIHVVLDDHSQSYHVQDRVADFDHDCTTNKDVPASPEDMEGTITSVSEPSTQTLSKAQECETDHLSDQTIINNKIQQTVASTIDTEDSCVNNMPTYVK